MCVIVLLVVQDDDFVARDDFEDADQLRIGNDGIFMLTFFSKISSVISTAACSGAVTTHWSGGPITIK